MLVLKINGLGGLATVTFKEKVTSNLTFFTVFLDMGDHFRKSPTKDAQCTTDQALLWKGETQLTFLISPDAAFA